MDREKIIKDLEFCVNGHFKVELSLATKILTLLKEQNDCENCAITIEDRQPVVRCKDCKYCDSEIKDGIKFAKCELKHNWMPQPNWFCADGERKSDLKATMTI